MFPVTLSLSLSLSPIYININTQQNSKWHLYIIRTWRSGEALLSRRASQARKTHIPLLSSGSYRSNGAFTTWKHTIYFSCYLLKCSVDNKLLFSFFHSKQLSCESSLSHNRIQNHLNFNEFIVKFIA